MAIEDGKFCPIGLFSARMGANIGPMNEQLPGQTDGKIKVKCPKCGGSGEWFGAYHGGRCFNCGGSGWVWKDAAAEAKKQSAAERKLQRAADEKAERFTAWAEANPEAAEFIGSLDIEGESKGKFTFLAEMARSMVRWGGLTDAQTAAVLKVKASREKQAAERASEVKPETAAPVGRVTVIGVVTSVKWQDSDFGRTRKWLVKLDDGNKVWTSVPTKFAAYQSSDEELRGQRIKLTATFERSKDDEHFSFGSRPSAEPA